jgi:CRP-like cAMP-binding protein
MRHADLRGQLHRVETPALVIWGAEDDIVPLRDAGVVAAEWPGADLRIIPNAGHWPQFEQPSTTLRHIINFLGLPNRPQDNRNTVEQEQLQIQEIAGFLTNSEIGRQLNAAQRLRLASLLQVHQYDAGGQVASMNTTGDEMFIVMNGTMEVWLTPSAAGGIQVNPVRLAVMHPGQVAGELALLDGAVRSADLRAGPEGVRLLSLNGDALAAITEDDPVMGMKIMQSLAVSLGRRMRLQNWQATRALEAARGSTALRVLQERTEN